MKKKTLSIIFSIVLICVVGCDSRTPINQQTNVSSSNSSAGSVNPEDVVATNNNVKPWPPSNGSSVVLAGDLLAKNYYIVFDGSGSMDSSSCAEGTTKFEAAKEALLKFIEIIPKDANFGLLAFDETGTSERLAIALNSSNQKNQFNIQLGKVGNNGGTPLHNAVVGGKNALENQARKQLGYGEYNLVIVTDGQPSAGQDPSEAVNYILANTPIVIHTIGFCIGENHALNQPGRTNYATADNPDKLISGLISVLAEAEDFGDVTDFN